MEWGFVESEIELGIDLIESLSSNKQRRLA